MFKFIGSVFNAAFGVVKAVVQPIFDFFGGIFHSAAQAVDHFFDNVMNMVAKGALDVLDKYLDKYLDPSAQKLLSAITPEMAGDILKGLVSKLISGKSIDKAMTEVLKDVMDKVAVNGIDSKSLTKALNDLALKGDYKNIDLITDHLTAANKAKLDAKSLGSIFVSMTSKTSDGLDVALKDFATKFQGNAIDGKSMTLALSNLALKGDYKSLDSLTDVLSAANKKAVGIDIQAVIVQMSESQGADVTKAAAAIKDIAAKFSDYIGDVTGLTMHMVQSHDLIQANALLNGIDASDLKTSLLGRTEVIGGTNITFGKTGNDIIKGTQGNDIIYGLHGNDTLKGDRGTDMLFGGQGKDTFVFAKDGSLDTVMDFEKGDRLDLSAFLDAFNPAQHAINKFVVGRVVGEDTIISVSEKGNDTPALDVAILKGVQVNIAALYNAQELLV